MFGLSFRRQSTAGTIVHGSSDSQRVLGHQEGLVSHRKIDFQGTNEETNFYHVEKIILNGVDDNSVEGGQGRETDG